MKQTNDDGFRFPRAKGPSWIDVVLQLSLQPLWQRRGYGVWWFLVSLILAALLFWIGVIQPSQTGQFDQFSSWINVLFLAIALAIQTSWFRSIWRPGFQFSLWSSGFNSIHLVLAVNLSGWIILLGMLSIPGLVAFLTDLGRDIKIWWEAPLWGLALWLSASCIAQWDALLRKLLPSRFSNPLFMTLVIAIFAASGVLLPLDSTLIAPFFVPGAATLFAPNTPVIVLGVAAIHWLLSLGAMWFAMRRNPLWLDR